MMGSQPSTGPAPDPEAPWTPRQLGALLCDLGMITQEQLQDALQRQTDVAPDKLLGQNMVEMGLITDEELTRVIAEVTHTPYTVLHPSSVQPEALTALPQELMREHNLLPLTLNDGLLSVAVEDFTDVFLLEKICQHAGCNVQVIAATGENIRQTREAVLEETAGQRLRADVANERLDDLLEEMNGTDVTVVENDEQPNDAELTALATDSPIVKLVNHIIHNAVEMRASDIHIEPGEQTFRARYRVDGDLVAAVRPPSRLLPAVVSRIKIISGMDISERRLPQDGGVSIMINNRPIDLRVSSMPTKYGEKVVMRVIDRSSNVQQLDKIGFADPMLAHFRALIQEKNGIVLVTGPTGSGKTTTLYGALAEIMSDRRNISTIEDPVERRLVGTNQFQVNTEAGFTFARALRALLRQDPDVVMVGEIRDTETARLATEAAMTGHLVLSTLHTNDAPTAVPRLINMGVEPYLVAASLRGVLAQRLVRRLCTHCRQPIDLTPAQQATLNQLCGGECPLEQAYTAPGCGRCRSTGYIGRAGIFELLMLNEELLSTVARDPGMGAIRQIAGKQGYTTLLHDGIDKLRTGVINLEGLLEIVSRTDEIITAPQDNPSTEP